MGSWRRRGRGGLIGSPAPGGSGRGPALLGEPLRSTPLPSLSLPSRGPGQGMSCSRRSLPEARGQGGPGGVLPSSPPPHLLPAQVRARAAATAAAPDSRRPRAGAGHGVGQSEGLGEPCGERASRRHLAAMPCAGERPRRPLGASCLRALSHPAGERAPPCQGSGQVTSRSAAGKVGRGPVGKRSFPGSLPAGFLLGRGE